MAVPTVSSMSPASGPPGGRTLVDIVGTGFRLPTAPPATSSAVLPPAAPSVRVLFGGLESPRVLVLTSTRLLAETPRCPLTHPTTGVPIAGAVDVVVQNIDDDGVLIGAEEVEVGTSFTYRRPPLTGTAAESVLVRVMRAMRRELSLCVLENTLMTVSGDWTTDPTKTNQPNYLDVAQLPALVMLGPTLSRSGSERANVPKYTVGLDGKFKRRRPTRIYDAQFDLVGVNDVEVPLLNLLAATVDFFDRHPLLYVDRDHTDPSAGQIEHEIDVVLPMNHEAQPDESDLRRFRGAFTIRAIDLEDLPDFADDGVADVGGPFETLSLGTSSTSTE